MAGNNDKTRGVLGEFLKDDNGPTKIRCPNCKKFLDKTETIQFLCTSDSPKVHIKCKRCHSDCWVDMK